MKLKNKFTIQKFERKGSAMILTMFILAGMLIVAMSGAYVVLLGITASGTQAQSTKAYFAAESGIEFILWNVRKNDIDYGVSQIGTGVAIEGPHSLSAANLEYSIFHTGVFHGYTSLGSFNTAKRSVEVSF